jgi:hypothetical protein
MPFSVDEIDRYGRQLILPEWGAAGQEHMLHARVRITGRGTAARTAALYLAGAGVGRLVVEEAADEVRARNPHVTVSVRMSLASKTPVVLQVAGKGVTRRHIFGAVDSPSVGAACAVEALKAILGLPHQSNVALPPEPKLELKTEPETKLEPEPNA